MPNSTNAVAVFNREAALNTITARLDEQTSAIQSALDGTIGLEKFKVLVARAIAKDDKLLRCTPLSLMRAIIDAAALGIEPTGKYGGGYLVPFWNKDVPPQGSYEATLIIGFDGLKEMAYRSKIVTLVEGDAVRANDDFSYRRGFPDAYLSHTYATAERGELVGAWAMVHLLGAPRPLMVYMPSEMIEKRRKVSKSGDRNGEPIGIWRQWPDEMYLKTALRSVLDLAPKSVIDIVSRAYAIEDAQDSLINVSPDPATAVGPGAQRRRRRLQAGAGVEVNAEDEAAGGDPAADAPVDPDAAAGTTETAADPEVAQVSGDEAAAAADAGPAPEGTESADATEVCGDPNPYDDGAPCGDPPGHGGRMHRELASNGDVLATWPVK